MKKLINAKIIDNKRVAGDIYRLTVEADMSGKPGQFVQVRLPSNEFTLRRPFGIAALKEGQVTMFYRVVGRGTEYLATLQAGEVVNLLGALGNGFTLTEGKVLLVGGGLGLAPLVFAARKIREEGLSRAEGTGHRALVGQRAEGTGLSRAEGRGQRAEFLDPWPLTLDPEVGQRAEGTGQSDSLGPWPLTLDPEVGQRAEGRGQSDVDVLIGGKNAEEANLWQSEFKPLVNELFITTDDGSAGLHGFVTDLLPDVLSRNRYAAILTCGPEVMMRRVAALARESNIPCQVSLERRMGCGLGACLSCSIDTINGRQKVCKDGPVFNAEDVFYARPR